MITLTLLHPIQSTPVQSWTFEEESLIRIGRSTDNHVILYSAVVSRHHVELRRVSSTEWEVLSLGANGTYLNGKQVSQVTVTDGAVIRLARSGPNLQLQLRSSPLAVRMGKETTPQTDISPLAGSQRVAIPPLAGSAGDSGWSLGTVTPPPTTLDVDEPNSLRLLVRQRVNQHDTYVDQQPDRPAVEPIRPSVTCDHGRAIPEMLFCPDCGQPTQPSDTIGEYQVVKTLSEDKIGVNSLVWRSGQTWLLRSLKEPLWQDRSALQLFEVQAQTLLALEHPRLPRGVEYFVQEGRPYWVSEFVHGLSVAQWVSQRGPWNLDQAIALLLQLCEVLSYLHNQEPSFLHLDLRPENLILQNHLQNQTELMLVGFLNLKALEGNSRLTSFGYSAPELLRGEPEIASDLFAIGAILVYLLTGKHPSVFYGRRDQTLRFYPEAVPGLTPELTALLRKLTNPQPHDRYGSAQEVAAVLMQLAS